MDPIKNKHSSYRLSERLSICACLFLVCALHTMIFGFFQIPDNFLNVAFHSNLFQIKFFFYAVVLITCILNSLIIRALSLKSIFITGLFFNLIGISLIWLSLSLGGNLPLVILSLLFIGAALISVLNCLITYIIIEFPKHSGVAIMALFAFSNGGVMVSNILFNVFQAHAFKPDFFLFTIILLASSILFIGTKFYTPAFPKHLQHLRKGSLIWKELHYRLGFFIITIIAYGICESIFGIWGENFLLQFMSENVANQTIAIFWLSMIVGQILLLLPIYLYSARRIFPFLLLLLIGTILFLERQTQSFELILSFILAGFGFAAIFPILLSFLETELITTSNLSHQDSYLPYTEMGTSFMLGGYFAGVGIIDLWVVHNERLKTDLNSQLLHLAIILLAAISLISAYLNWTSKNKSIH